MVGAIQLYGWDATNKNWVKVLVNSDGKLIIDPTEIFEDPPTDGETGKAPNSNWAHDHAANASAHHARYTDAEAKAAAVSDAAYGADWDGVTNVAPSKNAVYDKLESLGGAAITQGSYTGNNTANRAVAHGLGTTPKVVIIICVGTLSAADAGHFIINSGVGAISAIIYASATTTKEAHLSVTAPDSTNFYVGNATNYGNSANAGSETYYWVAIG